MVDVGVPRDWMATPCLISSNLVYLSRSCSQGGHEMSWFHRRKPPATDEHTPKTGEDVSLEWGTVRVSTRIIHVDTPHYVCQALPRDTVIHVGQRVEMRFNHRQLLWKMPLVVQEIMEPIPMLQLLQTGLSEDCGIRQAPRIPVYLPLRCLIGSDRFETHCLDLSIGGLRFSSPHAYGVGDTVQAVVDLRNRKAEIQGHITRVGPLPKNQWGTSIMFDMIRDVDRQAIAEFVNQEILKFN